MFIYIGFILAGVSVVSLGVIFYHTYRDPRWRVFNFHSRLASEAEIYNVSENPVISCASNFSPLYRQLHGK